LVNDRPFSLSPTATTRRRSYWHFLERIERS
jgi:hypothetical protein